VSQYSLLKVEEFVEKHVKEVEKELAKSNKFMGTLLATEGHQPKVVQIKMEFQETHNCERRELGKNNK
jgi:hypothetical protein